MRGVITLRGAAAPGGPSGRRLGPDRTAQEPGDGVGTARRRVAGHAGGPGIAAAPLGITRVGACELLVKDRPVAVGRAHAAQSRTSRTRVAKKLDRPMERTLPASTAFSVAHATFHLLARADGRPEAADVFEWVRGR